MIKVKRFFSKPPEKEIYDSVELRYTDTIRLFGVLITRTSPHDANAAAGC
jgi:hypothetical protein